jgi:hypothetical protein
MRRGLGSSLLLHLVVLLLVVFGLPQFGKEELMVAAPVPVEIISPDQAAQAPPRLRTPPPAPTPPRPQPVQEQAPPPPPPPPQPAPDDIPVPQPQPQQQTKPQEQAQVTPPRPPRPRPPVPAAQQKPPQERPKPANNQFANLLNDLATEQTPEPPQEGVADSPVEESPTLAQLLNGSELDAVRQQVMSCWLEPTGLREGEQLIVEIKVVVNRDRTVQSAKVVDNSRMRADPFYRTLGESAVRALYNPRCSPLLLPPDKYTTWRTITFRFSPGGIY